jgi:hypothetical protein
MSAYGALCKSLGYKHKNVIWNTGQLVVSDSTPIETKSHQYDEYLLGRARTQWRSASSIFTHQIAAFRKLKGFPRLIVINGMVRSGSTVSINIVTDLLEISSVPFVKYYISDLQSIEKFGDHIKQNPSLCFVLKTHTVSSELIALSKSIPSVYVYTKRNLLRVAVSYIRMSRNSCSPFFQEVPLCLSDITRVISDQIYEYKKTLELENCLIIDCSQFEDLNIKWAVHDIAKQLGIFIEDDTCTGLANLRMQRNNAQYCNEILDSSLTSLKHDKYTFFHKGHIELGGKSIEEYLSKEWVNFILNEFSDSIDENGNLL